LAFTPFIPGSQFLKIKKARAKGWLTVLRSNGLYMPSEKATH
jgi:hypothetical protein